MLGFRHCESQATMLEMLGFSWSLYQQLSQVSTDLVTLCDHLMIIFFMKNILNNEFYPDLLSTESSKDFMLVFEKAHVNLCKFIS